MPVYEYKAYNTRGKVVSDIVDADSPKSARQKLRKQGIFPTEIHEGKGAVKRGGGAQGAGAGSVEIDFSKYLERIGVADVAIATRQLGALLGAGIPLVECLAALSEQVEKEKFKIILREIREKVNEGKTLADAMADYPKVFGDLYVNMVRAGEQAGALDHVMERLADYTEGQVELRGKIVASMTYPVIMMGLAVVVVGFLMTFVVPKIAKLFSDMGSDLPMITRVVMWFSHMLSDYWWLVAGLIAGAVYLFRRFYRSETGRAQVDARLLKVPVMGPMLVMVSVSRFSSTLSTLMQAGVPLLKAMHIVQNIMGNVVLREVVSSAKDAVREGHAMNTQLKKSGHFPPMVTHMIAVGERTGELGPMLDKVATTYENQVSRRLATLTALLEPLMILIMGGVVFTIALAVLLPMLQMNTLGR